MKMKAKKAALEELRKKMHKAGGAGMFGGMGVEVKAADKESLLKGLEKASEIVKSDEIEEEMESGGDEMSPEEIMEKIKELQAMLPKKE